MRYLVYYSVLGVDVLRDIERMMENVRELQVEVDSMKHEVVEDT